MYVKCCYDSNPTAFDTLWKSFSFSFTFNNLNTNFIKCLWEDNSLFLPSEQSIDTLNCFANNQVNWYAVTIHKTINLHFKGENITRSGTQPTFYVAKHTQQGHIPEFKNTIIDFFSQNKFAQTTINNIDIKQVSEKEFETKLNEFIEKTKVLFKQDVILSDEEDEPLKFEKQSFLNGMVYFVQEMNNNITDIEKLIANPLHNFQVSNLTKQGELAKTAVQFIIAQINNDNLSEKPIFNENFNNEDNWIRQYFSLFNSIGHTLIDDGELTFTQVDNQYLYSGYGLLNEDIEEIKEKMNTNNVQVIALKDLPKHLQQHNHSLTL